MTDEERMSNLSELQRDDIIFDVEQFLDEVSNIRKSLLEFEKSGSMESLKKIKRMLDLFDVHIDSVEDALSSKRELN